MAEPKTDKQQGPPTAEDIQNTTQVATAGAQAAQDAETPEQAGQQAADAMKTERDRIGFDKMTDEDIDRIAGAFTDKVLTGLEQRGAFEPPPEPIQAPVAPAAPAQPGEAPPPAEEQPPAPPERRTFAHRFMGQ